MKLVNWNVQWATPSSPRRDEILRRIEEHEPEVVCLTETHIDLLPDGYVIASKPDYGYPIKEGRRKVLLWSRMPWEQNDDLGDGSLPPGRFVSGVTRTSVGTLTLIGVCIPWANARVNTASISHKEWQGRKRWDDHREYLKGLSKVLTGAPETRLIMLGDFNQQLPRGRYTPKDVHEQLMCVVASRLTFASGGIVLRGRRCIDHIAVSRDLTADSHRVIDNNYRQTRLSDHFGIAVDMSADVSATEDYSPKAAMPLRVTGGRSGNSATKFSFPPIASTYPLSVDISRSLRCSMRDTFSWLIPSFSATRA